MNKFLKKKNYNNHIYLEGNRLMLISQRCRKLERTQIWSLQQGQSSKKLQIKYFSWTRQRTEVTEQINKNLL